MNVNTTRIAVAGAGYIGQAHMDAAIVAPAPAASAIAQKHGVPLYASLAELFANETHHHNFGIVVRWYAARLSLSCRRLTVCKISK